MSIEETTTTEKGTDAKPQFDSESIVTVLHGWARVGPKEVHWIDNTKFEAGVARHVPYDTAKAWKKLPRMGQAIIILPDDANEGDFARATGIQPMSTPKFAAMLSAIDLDKLAGELGPERTQEIADKLLAYTNGKIVKDSQGKFRRKQDA